MHDDGLPRLEHARRRFAAARGPLLARAWGLAERFGTEPEASWSPPEVLAHVAEMLPYWYGELERILVGPDGAVPFGRTADDPVRIGVIGRDRTVPLHVLLDRIDHSLDVWTARLRSLPDDAAARRGLHPTLGEVPVPAFTQRFVLGHLEEHLDQLERLVEPSRSA